MLEGDMPTSENDRYLPKIVSNIQDGDYRVVITDHKEFLVLKILTINKLDFQIGFKLEVDFYANIFSIGCFDHCRDQIGYGIHLKNGLYHKPGTELPIRS